MKKLLAILLAIAMLLSFAACAKKDGGETTAAGSESASETENGAIDTSENEAESASDETQSAEAQPVDTAGKEVKLTEVGHSDKEVYINDGGLVYTDNDMSGVISLDGKHDTGAKYLKVKDLGRYFIVVTKYAENEKDYDGLNCCGLIDGNGNEIIPADYAAISLVGDRFAQACKVTEKTNDKDDYLVYFQSDDNRFSIGPKSGDVLYKGEWCIFDIETGKKLEGVTGTNRYIMSAYKNLLNYTTDDKKQIIVNEKGTVLPDDAELLENGCYKINSDEEITVFDSDGKEQFKLSKADGYSSISASKNSDYYVASKTLEDYSHKYCVLDGSGKVISTEFDNMPSLYGNLALCENFVYDLNGKKLFDSEVSSGYKLGIRNFGFVFDGNENFALFDEEGNLVCSVNGEDYYFDTLKNTLREKRDDKYFYFNWSSGKFDIEGQDNIGEGIVKVEKGDKSYAAVDTVTGKEIISDCESILLSGNSTDGLYLYAKSIGGTKTIYSLSFGA